MPHHSEATTPAIKRSKSLNAGLRIAHRITGNSSESLGLHPAVYFSNDKGKHKSYARKLVTA